MTPLSCLSSASLGWCPIRLWPRPGTRRLAALGDTDAQARLETLSTETEKR